MPFTYTQTDWTQETSRDLPLSLSAQRMQAISDAVATAVATYTSPDWSATETVVAPPDITAASLNRWEQAFGSLSTVVDALEAADQASDAAIALLPTVEGVNAQIAAYRTAQQLVGETQLAAAIGNQDTLTRAWVTEQIATLTAGEGTEVNVTQFNALVGRVATLEAFPHTSYLQQGTGDSQYFNRGELNTWLAANLQPYATTVDVTTAVSNAGFLSSIPDDITRDSELAAAITAHAATPHGGGGGADPTTANVFPLIRQFFGATAPGSATDADADDPVTHGFFSLVQTNQIAAFGQTSGVNNNLIIGSAGRQTRLQGDIRVLDGSNFRTLQNFVETHAPAAEGGLNAAAVDARIAAYGGNLGSVGDPIDLLTATNIAVVQEVQALRWAGVESGGEQRLIIGESGEDTEVYFISNSDSSSTVNLNTRNLNIDWEHATHENVPWATGGAFTPTSLPSLFPSGNNEQDFGRTANRWGTGHFNAISVVGNVDPTSAGNSRLGSSLNNAWALAHINTWHPGSQTAGNVAGHLVPTSAFDIGLSARRWRTGYFTNLNVTNAPWVDATTGWGAIAHNVLPDTDATSSTAGRQLGSREVGGVGTNRRWGQINAFRANLDELVVGGTQWVYDSFAQTSGDSYSGTHTYASGSTVDFTNATVQFTQSQVQGLTFGGGGGTSVSWINADGQVTGNIIPSANNVRDMGSNDRRFNEVFTTLLKCVNLAPPDSTGGAIGLQFRLTDTGEPGGQMTIRARNQSNDANRINWDLQNFVFLHNLLPSSTDQSQNLGSAQAPWSAFLGDTNVQGDMSFGADAVLTLPDAANIENVPAAWTQGGGGSYADSDVQDYLQSTAVDFSVTNRTIGSAVSEPTRRYSLISDGINLRGRLSFAVSGSTNQLAAIGISHSDRAGEVWTFRNYVERLHYGGATAGNPIEVHDPLRLESGSHITRPISASVSPNLFSSAASGGNAWLTDVTASGDLFVGGNITMGSSSTIGEDGSNIDEFYGDTVYANEIGSYDSSDLRLGFTSGTQRIIGGSSGNPTTFVGANFRWTGAFLPTGTNPSIGGSGAGQAWETAHINVINAFGTSRFAGIAPPTTGTRLLTIAPQAANENLTLGGSQGTQTFNGRWRRGSNGKLTGWSEKVWEWVITTNQQNANINMGTTGTWETGWSLTNLLAATNATAISLRIDRDIDDSGTTRVIIGEEYIYRFEGIADGTINGFAGTQQQMFMPVDDNLSITNRDFTWITWEFRTGDIHTRDPINAGSVMRVFLHYN